MVEAALWGAAGASSLVVGALIGVRGRASSRGLGLVMGFGVGVLISALAFELTEEAYALGGADAVALGLAAGALAFFAGNRIVARHGGRDRKRSRPTRGARARGILLGSVLDAIPESVVIGTTIAAGGEVGLAFVLAVFLSNVPEGMSTTAGLPTRLVPHTLRLCGAVVLGAGVAAAIGYEVVGGASGNAVGLLQSFAAGAVIVMVVDEMVPEALDGAQDLAGLPAALGFAVAFLLSTLD